MLHLFCGTKKALARVYIQFIGLNECYLKIKYGGILLVDVGRDPYDQYLSIDFIVIENATKDS